LHLLAHKSRRFSPSRVALLLSLAPICLGCSRNQPQAATIPKLPQVEFIEQWGIRGQAPGQLEIPVGPATDMIGRVYLADRGTTFVQKFETSGIPLLTFEHPSARTADAIAVDSGGAIYLSNARAGVIQVFFPEGQPLRVLRIAPQRAWKGPFAFSVDADGRIFVPDPSGGRVQVLTPEGRVRHVWRIPSGSPGVTSHPFTAMAGSDGFVYVGDAASGRVLKFTSAGEQVASWRDASDAPPLVSLAVGRSHLFVLSGGQSLHLEVWDLGGRQELVDDLGGQLVTAKSSSVALAADALGNLLVLDSEVPRVLHFRIHLDSRE
jgi:hypothetical protein